VRAAWIDKLSKASQGYEVREGGVDSGGVVEWWELRRGGCLVVCCAVMSMSRFTPTAAWGHGHFL